MTSRVLPTLQQRLDAIEKETSGVASMYGITSWEKEFMKSLRPLKFGSDKQNAVLGRIEIKVFGKDRSDG